MLQTMVARFNQEAASIGLPEAAKAAQLTEGQVITVASILEAEAGSPKYYPEVAEVIYNRLNSGMFLGLDSTVNYALHRSGVSLTTTPAARELAVQHLHPQGPAARADRQPGQRGHPGRAASRPRELPLLRDREPEDRAHAVHQQRRPVPGSSRPSASRTTHAEAIRGESRGARLAGQPFPVTGAAPGRVPGARAWPAGPTRRSSATRRGCLPCSTAAGRTGRACR